MTIPSPENYFIGCILGKDICIYPGTLEGAFSLEDVKILYQILYWSLPRVASCQLDDARFELFCEKYKNLKQGFYHKLIETKNKKSIMHDMRKFMQQGLQKRLLKSRDDLESSQAKAVKKKVEYFEALTKLVELEERLENLRKLSETVDFALEFEKILGMEVVGTLRIVEENNNHIIVINTRRVFQAPIETSSRRYDLGEYEIHINTSIATHSGIFFYQNRYAGQFKHQFANPTNTCFGTNPEAGLNADIDKLMMEFDLAPLIHVIITFLIKEGSVPIDRKLPVKEYKPSPDNEYASPEDRQKEKEAFIKLCREEIFMRLKQNLEPDINATKALIISAEDQRASFHFAAKEAELNIQLLEGGLQETDHLSSSEINKLLDSKNIYNLEIKEDEIHIYFDSPQLPPRSYPKITGYILRISHDVPPELLFPSDDSIMHRMQLIPDSFMAKYGDKINSIEKQMANFQFQEEVSDLFELVKGFISNGICDDINTKPLPRQIGPMWGSGWGGVG